MSEQQPRTLYVMVDYRDPEGVEHKRGESITAEAGGRLANELLFRGVLSAEAPRRRAGENSSRTRKG